VANRRAGLPAPGASRSWWRCRCRPLPCGCR